MNAIVIYYRRLTESWISLRYESLPVKRITSTHSGWLDAGGGCSEEATEAFIGRRMSASQLRPVLPAVG